MTFPESIMEKAVPVLFWAAVIMFFGGIALVIIPSLVQVTPYSSEPGIGPGTLVAAIVNGVNEAAIPFAGGAIVWALRRNKEGSAE